LAAHASNENFVRSHRKRPKSSVRSKKKRSSFGGFRELGDLTNRGKNKRRQTIDFLVIDKSTFGLSDDDASSEDANTKENDDDENTNTPFETPMVTAANTPVTMAVATPADADSPSVETASPSSLSSSSMSSVSPSLLADSTVQTTAVSAAVETNSPVNGEASVSDLSGFLTPPEGSER